MNGLLPGTPCKQEPDADQFNSPSGTMSVCYKYSRQYTAVVMILLLKGFIYCVDFRFSKSLSRYYIVSQHNYSERDCPPCPFIIRVYTSFVLIYNKFCDFSLLHWPLFMGV
jgi:hypothetical protein